MTKVKEEEIPAPQETKIFNQVCGIIMPIAELDGCSENHWLEVRSILTEAIEGAGFRANLVSNAEDIGVIQKRIIENLYSNPIVVCDVSAKNANVMFELGLRLAFDKPTIIVKDDKTNYSFDTSPIEHLTYPRDLRFSRIVEFKRQLTDKIVQTIKKANNDPDYSTFLKHFGAFKVPKIDTQEVSKDDYLIEQVKNLTELILNINKPIQQIETTKESDRNRVGQIIIHCDPISNEYFEFIELLKGISGLTIHRISNSGNQNTILVKFKDIEDFNVAQRLAIKYSI
ncbi:hypothetical protein [Runella sp. CRIBMP]|uniref:hypothetical protein n=1 Tax=Runella sp. CRIBMP TaxID=2683261 RepID=UPI00197EE39C|nr:hypothetical protein [Runella sp. CRIBMP]